MDLKKLTHRITPALFALAALLTPAGAWAQTGPAAPAPDPARECGCEAAPLPEVLATAGGVRITARDLSAETRQKVAALQQQVVEARRRELDLQINSRLLEAEAKRRGVSTAKLLQAEVVARTQEPTEADAQKFFDENRARIQGEFKDLKSDIVAYLREQRQRELAAKLSERLRAAARVQKNVEAAPPPAKEADRARVLATVDGQPITSADVEDSLRPLVFSVQEQVYGLRRQEVELKINDLLLGQEARKRGVTARALLDAEVESKLPAVAEADAQKFFDENRERISGDFAQVREQVVQYLRDAQTRRAMNAYAERLRAASPVQVFIAPPEPPVYKIATDDQPSQGRQDAALTLVEFTDFQCPSCAQRRPVLERIAAEYGGRVRIVVRDYPLSQHADAPKAAEAAEAAREQGKYWEYAALLFQNQSALKPEHLKQYATRLGLDRAKFDAALDSGRLAKKVQRDVADGDRVGVAATPSFFLNGRRVSDTSYEGLKAAIESALKAPAE
jgi:protein-disulfide isomerase